MGYCYEWFPLDSIKIDLIRILLRSDCKVIWAKRFNFDFLMIVSDRWANFMSNRVVVHRFRIKRSASYLVLCYVIYKILFFCYIYIILQVRCTLHLRHSLRFIFIINLWYWCAKISYASLHLWFVLHCL